MRHFLHYRFAFMGLVSVLLLLTSCASSTKTTVSKPKVTISNIGGSYAPICATGTPCTTLGTAPTVHAGSSKPAPTGAITIGDWQTPDTINPFYADEHVDYAIMSAIYGSCVVAGADLKWLPDQCVEVPTLANKDVSADGLTVTMKLLSNLQWSDGQPLTSADYQWTWQTLVDAKTSAFNIGGYAVIDHIDTPDAHTVVVHFKAALGPYLSYLPFALPQHEFGKADHTQLATSAEFNFKPTATSGAYAVSDFALGDHWTLAPNPHYTSTTFYGPFLKSITFQSYPDTASEVKAFTDGKLTVAQNFAPANLDALKGIAPASLKTVGSVGYEHVEYNQSNPVLAKPAVRQALTLAVDRCAIVQKVLGQPCATTVATSIVTPAALDFDKTLTAPAADTTKANALLDKAGFTQKGSDGIRLDSAGKPITLTLVTVANDSVRTSEATLLAADWKAIGIGVTITPTAANLLFADFNHGGILANGQWGIAIFAYVGTADPDFTYPIYHSSGIPTKDNPTGTNYAHINEPQIDAALQQERAVIDFDTRVAALKQVQQIVVAQSFDVTPLYVWPVISATSTKLQNALFSPALYATDWNIADWSLAA